MLRFFTTVSFLFLVVLGAAFSPSDAAPTSELKHYFYVDGKPFFIRAIGYAPWRPGQWPDPPTEQVDVDLIEADVKRIKQAGFNTIRSWGSLNAREIKIIEKHGLMIVQGIWLNPNIDYSDPITQKSLIKQLKWEIGLSRGSPNILMYMVLTEPKPGAVLSGGVRETEEFFKLIKKTVQEIDPRPVSMDSWLPIAFMDHSMWDVVTFNTFAFAPACVTYALGFQGYNEWLRVNVAKDKPYFVAETGGYGVSPSTFGVKGGGAGGFTEKEQSRHNLENLRDIEKSGAIGWTLVAWNDTWHYPEDPNTQDPNEPWEWDGVIGFESFNDRIGRPRQIFYDLPKFNRQTARRYRQPSPPGPLNAKAFIQISPLNPDATTPSGPGFIIQVRDSMGSPVPSQEVKVGFFVPEPWLEATVTGKTDALGQLTVKSPLRAEGENQVLIVAAGAWQANKQLGGNIIFVNRGVRIF